MNRPAEDNAALLGLLLGTEAGLLLLDASNRVLSVSGKVPWCEAPSQAAESIVGTLIDLPSYFVEPDRAGLAAQIVDNIPVQGATFTRMCRMAGTTAGWRFITVKMMNLLETPGVHALAFVLIEQTAAEMKAQFRRWTSHIVETLGKCSVDQLNDEVLSQLDLTSQGSVYDVAEITVRAPSGRARRWFWSRHHGTFRQEVPRTGFSANAHLKENGLLPPTVWRASEGEGTQIPEWAGVPCALTVELVERWGAGMTTTFRFGYPSSEADEHLSVVIEGATQRLHAFQPSLVRLGADAVAAGERHRAAVIFRQLSDFVLVWSPDGKVQFANDSFARALGVEPWQIVGVDLAHILVGSEPILRSTRALASGETGTKVQVRFRMNDRVLVVEASTTNLCEDEHVGGYLTVARDVTEYLEKVNNAAERERLTEVVASISNRFVTATTASTSATIRRALADIARACPVERLLVWHRQPDGLMRVTHEHCAPGVAPLGSSIPPIDSSTMNLLTVALEGQPELCVRGGHGDAFVRAVSAPGAPELGAVLTVGLRAEDGPTGVLTFSAIYDTDGAIPGLRTLERPVVQSTLQTVGELFASVLNRAATQEALAYNASHDTLTGLANRRLLLERADRMLQTAHRRGNGIGLLFMDLDDFKTVNDSLGHDAGDELLKDVAERLLRLSGGSTVIARLGGDEFVVLFESSDPERSANRIASQVMNHLASPFRIRGRQLSVRVSIGGATASSGHTHEVPSSDLVRRADMAMYQAKRRGGNSFEMFSEWLEDQVTRKFNLHEELSEAISADQLELHFQPKIKLATGATIGCEALVRWRHPAKGFILPNEFIGLAEQTGLINELGDWVFTRAVEAARNLIDNNLVAEHFSIAVNVSSVQLVDSGLVTRFLEITDRVGVHPSRFIIELTESTLAERDRVIPNLEAFRAAGFRTSIDDFGTGFSSLSYLRDLPLDELKIDRSFIKSLGEDRRDLDMVWALVEMAHSLGLEVVAEGVETELQRSHLENMGCNTAQGWLFAKALPLHELVAALAPSENPAPGSKISQLIA